MRHLYAKGMTDLSAAIERITVLLSEWEEPTHLGGAFVPTEPVDNNLLPYLAKSYQHAADAAEILGLPMTGLAAQRAKKRVQGRKEPITWLKLKQINNELGSRFDDELESVKLYCLAKGADAYYSPAVPLFGPQVDTRIPGASNDISEAGKCFAVGRYTSCVFHLMRAMEVAVQTLSTDLGVGNLERAWGQLLSDIHTKVEAMPKGDERNGWSQVHANLYHVKQAWRNDTMHPKATYTEEEAREVFDAMRAFMRHLASMLPPTVAEGALAAYAKRGGV